MVLDFHTQDSYTHLVYMEELICLQTLKAAIPVFNPLLTMAMFSDMNVLTLCSVCLCVPSCASGFIFLCLTSPLNLPLLIHQSSDGWTMPSLTSFICWFSVQIHSRLFCISNLSTVSYLFLLLLGVLTCLLLSSFTLMNDHVTVKLTLVKKSNLAIFS